jgi:hypothetical protein
MEVFCPPGYLIGSIVADGPKEQKVFTINDESGETKMKIEGHLLSLHFQICTIYGHEIGKISRDDPKFSQDSLISYDNMYDLSFPIDLDAKMKIILLGASILIVSMKMIPKISTKNCEKIISG